MANRPVIAHVLHRLDRAGAEVLAAGLARGLADRFDFMFLCLDGPGVLADELADEGFAVEALGRQPGLDRTLAKRLRDRLTHHRVGLIHAHQYTPFFYSAVSRGLFKNTTPLLFTEHGRHVPDTTSLKRRLANKLLLKKTDRVTAVSQFVKHALIKNEGMPAARIDVVHNGIDPGPEPNEDGRAAARQQLGITPDRPVVMQVARFHPVKDHATALRAWSIVHAQMPDALLVFVGDGPERDNLEALTQQLELQDAVRFTGGVDDARQLIPAADLCMLSSLSEGLSVTLLEAMAAGKPIVATDVGGNPEAVVNGQTGLLAPSRDPGALAGCVMQLLPNAPYTARVLGQAGRQRLLEHFTADRMHRAYAQHYESLAADASSR
ncbi:MAG: glycosyltransferase [Phycisphaeraceae bacterium]|nr:glycosyltransferase [Phycisphaeraceae bacterium]